MKILSFIEALEIVKKILKHLGLCEVKARPPPQSQCTIAKCPYRLLRFSGPTLRSISIVIRITQLRFMPYDFSKPAKGSKVVACLDWAQIALISNKFKLLKALSYFNLYS